MSFCYSPWTNLDISPMGSMSPCCKFQSKKYQEKFNIQSSSISQYNDSKFLAEIKQEMLQGQWPVGCERCKIEEENNIKSKRQLDFERWQEHYKMYDFEKSSFITSSIAFGNTCNLKCITCGPTSSSRWQKEYESITGIEIQNVKFYKKDFVETFLKNTPNIVHIDIPGGEPFLSGVDEQQLMLKKYIESGRARQISLHYTTNATIYPSESWWELWSYFGDIDLQISVDGVGDRFEYIRFPGKWNDLVTNTQQYLSKEKELSNFRISVSHTVSAYNIFYLDEFFSWCYNIGLPRPWLGRVHNPAHMRPAVWPHDARDFIAQKLYSSKYNDVKTWAQLMQQTDDSCNFKLFVERVKQHDLYRSLDFKNTFPELAKFL